jgi:hypothetical protein
MYRGGGERGSKDIIRLFGSPFEDLCNPFKDSGCNTDTFFEGTFSKYSRISINSARTRQNAKALCCKTMLERRKINTSEGH